MSERSQIHVLVFGHNPAEGSTYFLDTQSSDLLDPEEAREEALDEAWADELWNDDWEPVTIAASMTTEETQALQDSFASMRRGTVYLAEVTARHEQIELVLGEVCVFDTRPENAAAQAQRNHDRDDTWPQAEVWTKLTPLVDAVELSDEEAQSVHEHDAAYNHATD